MTTVDEPSRHSLYDALIETLGADEAGTLMQILPKSDWEDVVTKPYLDARLGEVRSELHGEMAGLREEMRKGFTDVRGEIAGLRAEVRGEISDVRGETAGLRTELGVGLADLRSEMHAAMRAQLMWMIGAMIALTGVLLAAITTVH